MNSFLNATTSLLLSNLTINTRRSKYCIQTIIDNDDCILVLKITELLELLKTQLFDI